MGCWQVSFLLSKAALSGSLCLHFYYATNKWWIEVSVVDFDQVIESKYIISKDDEYIAKKVNEVEFYESIFFDDWDFLDECLSSYIQMYKIYGPALEKYVDINLEDYIEILPDDKAEEFHIAKRKFELPIVKDNIDINKEQLIVKGN